MPLTILIFSTLQHNPLSNVRCCQVDDQMNLLQHSWSDILLLDHIHQRMHNNLADDMQLPNGQRFDLLTLALLGATNAADQLHALTMKLSELKFDTIDYTCLKFLLLLNPGKSHFRFNFELLLHSSLRS